MDLLDHEVLVSALLSCLSVPGYVSALHLHFIAVQVEEVSLSGKQPYRLQIVYVIDVTGVLQHSRHIGCQEGLAVCDAYHHRAVLSGSIYLAGVIFEH